MGGGGATGGLAEDTRLSCTLSSYIFDSIKAFQLANSHVAVASDKLAWYVAIQMGELPIKVSPCMCWESWDIASTHIAKYTVISYWFWSYSMDLTVIP